MTIAKPDASEFAPFYAGYVGKVSSLGPRALLEQQIGDFERLRSLAEDKANHRYADGKWSVKEVLGHMSDGERVFGYRLVRIARGDKTPLAGFDENEWAAAAPHANRPISAIADELVAVRRATVALVDSLDDQQLANSAEANGKLVSARAICWIIPGHAQHHLDVLRERYGVTAA